VPTTALVQPWIDDVLDATLGQEVGPVALRGHDLHGDDVFHTGSIRVSMGGFACA
jgi:hypothetical protein